MTLPKPRKKDWAKIGVLVTLFLGLLGIAVAIMTSSWDKTDKEFSIIVIVVLGYIAYNEISK